MDLLHVPSTGPGKEQALNRQIGDQGRKTLTGTSVIRYGYKYDQVRCVSNSKGSVGSGFQGKTGWECHERKRCPSSKAESRADSGIRDHSRRELTTGPGGAL